MPDFGRDSTSDIRNGGDLLFGLCGRFFSLFLLQSCGKDLWFTTEQI